MYNNVQCRYTAASSSVRIWLDEVACSLTDTTLIECSFDPNTGDCSHSEDVAIICSTITTTTTPTG